MARCFRGFVLLMAVSAVGILSQAQPAAAPIEQVHLGDSVVALNRAMEVYDRRFAD